MSILCGFKIMDSKARHIEWSEILCCLLVLRMIKILDFSLC